MTRSRAALTTTLALLVAGAIAFGLWQHSVLARARADLAVARATIAELSRQPEARPGADHKETLPTSESTAPAAKAQPAAETAPAWRMRPGRMAQVMADLASDPEIGPLMLNQRKRAVAVRYAVLLARLGLPPEQTEQLKTLLAEKQLSHTEAQAMAHGQGLGRDEEREMAKQSDTESDAAIKALLGDTGFSQLEDYDRTYPQRTEVGSLAERLGYAGAPLPAAQQEQLIQILATNAVAVPGAPRGEQGGGFFGAGGPGGRGGPPLLFFGREVSEADIQTYATAKAASDAVTLQQASAILTPAQLAALQQLQQEENEQLKLTTLTVRRMRQARGAGGG